MIATIELLSLLRASSACLNLYEKIVFWVEKRFLNVLLESLPMRDKVIKVMEKWHHLQCIAPIKNSDITLNQFAYQNSSESIAQMHLLPSF